MTYTGQRAGSLMGFFYRLTLYAFLRGWLLTSVVACALGIATKEVMTTAPLLVLLYDRAFFAGSFSAAKRARCGYYARPCGDVGAPRRAGPRDGGDRGGTVGLGRGVPLWAYPLTQFAAICGYLALGIWPHPLVFEYGTRWVHGAREVLPHAALLLSLLGATLLALWRNTAAGFGGAGFFLILAPTSLAPGTIQMTLEHRAYLPLATRLTLRAAGGYHGLGRRLLPGLAILALALGLLTARRNADCHSAVGLGAATVAKRPDNPRARDSLATALAATGPIDAALAQRREVVRLQPDNPKYLIILRSISQPPGRQRTPSATTKSPSR